MNTLILYEDRAKDGLSVIDIVKMTEVRRSTFYGKAGVRYKQISDTLMCRFFLFVIQLMLPFSRFLFLFTWLNLASL